MSTKGFLLLLVTVIAIGGSIGGAFAGGLALGRSQGDDSGPGAALLQQQFGGGFTGAIQGGQFGGAQSGGGLQPGQDALSGLRAGGFAGETGAEFTRDVFNGTVSTLDGNTITVAAGEEVKEVDLGGNTSIQIFGSGIVDDISEGDSVLVIVSGDTTAGVPIDAMSVIVNPPEGGGAFGGGVPGGGGIGGGGGFGGRGGFGGGGAISIGVVSGTVSHLDGNQITVATESGESQVNLGDDLTVQIYSDGNVEDIFAGDRVLVITASDDESGEPVTTTSVIVNPPDGGGLFGSGGGFGGRRQRP